MTELHSLAIYNQQESIGKRMLVGRIKLHGLREKQQLQKFHRFTFLLNAPEVKGEQVPCSTHNGSAFAIRTANLAKARELTRHAHVNTSLDSMFATEIQRTILMTRRGVLFLTCLLCRVPP